MYVLGKLSTGFLRKRGATPCSIPTAVVFRAAGAVGVGGVGGALSPTRFW